MPIESAIQNALGILTESARAEHALGNTIAGALGGVGGGQILTALLPMIAGTADNVDIGAIVGQAVGGGVAGAIVTFVVGLIKNTMAGQPAR